MEKVGRHESIQNIRYLNQKQLEIGTDQIGRNFAVWKKVIKTWSTLSQIFGKVMNNKKIEMSKYG
jgi:hypothetical protein